MTGVDEYETQPTEARRRWRRKRVLVPATVALVFATALGGVWLERNRIADNTISSQLESYGLTGRYDLREVTPGLQVIDHLVIGDPTRPDLTVEQVQIRIHYRLGAPTIGSITLVKPRLYGRQKDGRISFGSLDKAIYRNTGKAPGLPDLDLVVNDGRALITTDYGPLGLKLEGAGRLSDGFQGVLAVAAPQLAFHDCSANGTSLYGTISTDAGKPNFSGPLRMANLSCSSSGIALGRSDVQLDVSSDAQLRSVNGKASITTDDLKYAAFHANGAELGLRLAWRGDALELKHTVALHGVSSPQVMAALVTLDGSSQASTDFSRLTMHSTLEGNSLRPGPMVQSSMADFADSGQGTLLAPIMRKFSQGLMREARGSTLVADMTVRRSDGGTTMIVPKAEMRGRSGARLLALSRVQLSRNGASPLRLSGNLVTDGRNLPHIYGRMEQLDNGSRAFRMTMQPFSAGDSSLAIPTLTLARGRDGALGFVGKVSVSGDLPGGSARNLSLPVDGRYASGGRLSLWTKCVDASFDKLELAQLELDRHELRLCPEHGRAILERVNGQTTIAAGTPQLDLSGKLGETPIRLASGAVGFAYPGAMTANQIAVVLGPEDTASRFHIDHVDAQLDKNLTGHFSGAEVKLNAVPFDLSDAGGEWRYDDGRLTLSNASFKLDDRQRPRRFETLMARDAGLTLVDNAIAAKADLRDPGTGRVVTRVAIDHNLASGNGHADLVVAGLTFDDKLQPDMITPLAKGLVANVDGSITGNGTIAWRGGKITSSGDFSSRDLDFAAAFGPVKGARGTIHFTDLLKLTTAPDQTLHIASVNPGIEAKDGVVHFHLTDAKQLAVEGGSWPFMGGRLSLRKVDLNFGVKEERRYVFDISGLDAGVFVDYMQLGNIGATGTFDGTVPIVFDESGNGRIEGGLLTSRTPGGNVAYVGNLTYKDLSPIANFAFNALRSLDYDKMEVEMDGPLTGEIVTKVRFDGVHQGAGAKSNIITRQLAKLPLQFRINVRAPFYQLITSLKSLRDPAAVRDPRELGLVTDDGTRLKESVRGDDVKPKVAPSDIIPGNGTIQHKESEK
ncbi:MAG: YdbH domain-containing protein [Sphingomonadaceae bacterium]